MERTPFNSNHVDMDLNEGQVVIFPSKTLHQTIQSESDEDRISLVADIAIMLKDDSECEKFMPAFSLWKKL
jgi:ectoine hydroxylase-related dioxygenase (phytanoyl-CoA dioxygenase family)